MDAMEENTSPPPPPPPTTGAKPPPYKDPDDGRQRFLLELEFIQCLANPIYINCTYLKYWQRPEYIKYIMYPHCLFFLELLQNANFRNAMAHPANKEVAHRQQYFFWKNYRNNRLKHILPRPPPEPTPAPAPLPTPPPVPAPPSSLPTMSAVGASAMPPMQFIGTPGTNNPKNDMRNVMGGRKRKMG
ncbi:hypothetical protein ACQ4PT_017894 [Festuca glaucescens]